AVAFAAGESAKTVSLSVVGDTNPEPDEAFSVVLSGASGAVIGTASASGVIRNDDAAAPPPPPPPSSEAEPTALEQYFLELVNLARLDPAGAAAKYGFTLSNYAPRQPLAWNDDLSEAAQAHTDWMYANRVLSHTGEGGSSVYTR